MAAYLDMAEDDFIQGYTELARNRSQLTLVERADGACVFLEGNRCRIYAARPAQCRAFPSQWRVTGCPVS